MEDKPDNPRTLNLAGWAAYALLALTSIGAVLNGELPFDFHVYWQGAHDFLDGGDPYVTRDLSYVYPPASLLLFAPLAMLPVQIAGAVWAAILWGLGAFAATRFAKILALPAPAGLAAALGLMFFPFYRALEPLNYAVLSLALLALVGGSLERVERSSGRELGLGILAGFLLAIKPQWLMVGLTMAFLQRRWQAAAGMIVGLFAMLFVSLTMDPLFDAFVEKISWAVGTQWTVDLWSLSPVAGVVGVLAWSAAAVYLWRRGHPHAWVFAFTAIAAWPRPQGYSYIVILPVLFYVIPRLGRRGLVLAALLSTPAGFLLMLDLSQGGLALELGHTWRSQVISGVLYLTNLVLAVLLFRWFSRHPPRTEPAS